jgi:hypothetical protein
MAIAGAWLSANTKMCGYRGHTHYNPDTNQEEQEVGVVAVGKDEDCPPGTFPEPPHHR